MSDNDQAVLRLDVLYSEAFLNKNYLSLIDLARLRQVNRELSKSSRLYRTLQSAGMKWIPSVSAITDINHPRTVMEKLRGIIFNSLVQNAPIPNHKKLHSFYLFLGGTAPLDFMIQKALQANDHRGPELVAKLIYSLGFPEFATMCGLMLADTLPMSTGEIFGFGMLGITATVCAGALTKRLLIALENRSIYAEIEKLDNVQELLEIPVIPRPRNIFSRCFKNLFFRAETHPSEVTPLVSENNSCAVQPDYAKK